jgi:hypothetical protein
MTKEEIQQKVKELQLVMSKYKNNLGTLEKELFQAISDYQKALDQEKIKEIKQSLNI